MRRLICTDDQEDNDQTSQIVLADVKCERVRELFQINFRSRCLCQHLSMPVGHCKNTIIIPFSPDPCTSQFQQHITSFSRTNSESRTLTLITRTTRLVDSPPLCRPRCGQNAPGAPLNKAVAMLAVSTHVTYLSRPRREDWWAPVKNFVYATCMCPKNRKGSLDHIRSSGTLAARPPLPICFD